MSKPALLLSLASSHFSMLLLSSVSASTTLLHRQQYRQQVHAVVGYQEAKGPCPAAAPSQVLCI